ncbi:hypothetical protein FACS189485_18270 [Spirochaetia bacterium]|nr:hypothetical protein FACS189485_18270 [Spirochaetia bacterium]
MKKILMILFVMMAAAALAFAGGGKDSKAEATGGNGQTREITVMVFDRGTDGGRSDPTNNNWTAWIKEKVLKDENIKVTFIPIPRATRDTALNNLIAAGTQPDVCMTYSSELIGQYRDLGGVLNLEPYVDTLLVDLKNFLGPDQALPGRDFIRRMAESDGSLYSLPARRMNTALFGTFIRKDWLDKLGLPLPKTTQQFYEAMVAFKQRDPGGVGTAKVVPFTLGRNVYWRAGVMLNSFIDPNLSDKELWVNDVVGRNYLLPGYKEGVRFLNKMYNEGLVDRDFPLYIGDEPSDNLVKTGVVGAYINNWDQVYRDNPGVWRDLKKNVPTAELVPCDPFTNSKGITSKGAYDAAGIFYFVPAASKEPEAAVRYINWLARFENYNFLQIGPEGIVHDMEDGIPKLKSAAGLWIQNGPQNIDYTMHINGLDLKDPELTAKALANSYTAEPELIVAAYDMAMKNAKPGVVIPVTLTAAGPYSQTLVDKGDVLMAGAITAPIANFDRVWDAGIADWLASGAQIIRDERAAKYIAP